VRFTLPIALAAAVGLSACSFNEGLIIQDMTGTVVVPREAATRVMPNGETITDVRLIGPVILGFYPSIRNDLYPYPHPDVGPAFSGDLAGDTYPYGGTTVGDIRHPCVSDLACRVTSDRFVSYDDILDWYATYFEEPVVDSEGNPIETGEYIRQTCFERQNYTLDEEIRLVADDSNDDGVVDKMDLQFVENADGDFEAEFTVIQQEYFEGEVDGEMRGMTLWGWMDSPSKVDGRLSTCNDRGGQSDTQYDDTFQVGVQYRTLLNFPSEYIQEGDYVSTEGFTYSSPDDEAVITLDFEVEE